jgi:hypothetical protein
MEFEIKKSKLNKLLYFKLNRNLSTIIHKYIDYSLQNLLNNIPTTRKALSYELKTNSVGDIMAKCVHLGYKGFFVTIDIYEDLFENLFYQDNRIVVEHHIDRRNIILKNYMKVGEPITCVHNLDIFEINHELFNN